MIFCNYLIINFFLVHSVYAPCNLISIITLMVLIIFEGKERREGVEVSNYYECKVPLFINDESYATVVLL